MSTRSKFERKLAFRELGFSIKIPDVGRSLKPFDYVVGVPMTVNNRKILRFVAIEAKKAYGWTLGMSEFRDHQIRALNIVESFAPMTAWVAIGFLDMPRMKLDWNRKRLETRMPAQAYLIPWVLCKTIAAGGSVKYKDLIESYPEYVMGYGKVRSAYKWYAESDHPIFDLI